MGSIISYEEACNIPVVWDHLDIKNMQIFKDASENGSCSIVKSTSTNPVGINIFVKYDLGVKDNIGFIISPSQSNIDVWIARDYDGDICSSDQVILNLDINLSLKEVIAKAIELANICPVCKTPTPYKDQSTFSFAGRCCQKCLPEMKRKYEQPGWYN